MPVTCEKCGRELQIGDYPFCGKDGYHGRQSNSVIGDEIDVEVKHGLCWDDGTPRRFRSRAELAKVAREKGLTNVVEHVPKPGSDKSPHTTRWI